MKKIIAFAIVVFLSACENKNTESESLDQVNLRPSSLPASHTKKIQSKPDKKIIIIPDTNVIITAKILFDTRIQIKNPFAKIISQNKKNLRDLETAISTNIVNDKIIFPPINPGLTDLRIVVKGDNIASSYSDVFNTYDKTNKCILVNILNEATLTGKVTREDGTPVTNFFFQAVPRGVYEKDKNIGHISTNLTTDESGTYKISGLIMESYKLKLKTADSARMTYDVRFDEKENYKDFIFKNVPQKTINGIVVYRETKEPAQNINVSFYLHDRIKKNTRTDNSGKFSFKVKAQNFYGFVETDEPDYAKTKRCLYDNYNSELVVLLLCKTAIIKGTITDQNGKPTSGISVTASPTFRRHRSSTTINCSNEKITFMESFGDYRYKSVTPSDEFGDYVISNVAAPETYSVQVINDKNYFLDEEKETKTSVQPFEIAVCDFTVSQKPVIMIKVLDEKNNVVKNYMLKVRLEDGATSERSSTVRLKETNLWYKLSLIHLDNYNQILSLCAVLETGGKIFKTNVPCDKPGKYYIVLKQDKPPEPLLAGFIYSYDNKPLVDNYIYVNVNNHMCYEKTDHLGFFEVVNPQINLEEQKGRPAKIKLHIKHEPFETNVVVGDVNIEWILPRQREISGCVFIDDSPATSFITGVFIRNRRREERKSFENNDGKFSMLLPQYFKDKEGKIKIYVEGYNPVSANFFFDNSKTCDVGKIIVNDLMFSPNDN